MSLSTTIPKRSFLPPTAATLAVGSQVVGQPSARPIGQLLKRGFDIVGAALLLIALAPLLPLLAIAVWLDGGPALYRHTRVGFGLRPFGCLKYRTMVLQADAVLARHLRDDPQAAAEWAIRRASWRATRG